MNTPSYLPPFGPILFLEVLFPLDLSCHGLDVIKNTILVLMPKNVQKKCFYLYIAIVLTLGNNINTISVSILKY